MTCSILKDSRAIHKKLKEMFSDSDQRGIIIVGFVRADAPGVSPEILQVE